MFHPDSYLYINVSVKVLEVFSMLQDTLQEIVMLLLASFFSFQLLSFFQFLGQPGFSKIL